MLESPPSGRTEAPPPPRKSSSSSTSVFLARDDLVFLFLSFSFSSGTPASSFFLCFDRLFLEAQTKQEMAAGFSDSAPLAGRTSSSDRSDRSSARTGNTSCGGASEMSDSKSGSSMMKDSICWATGVSVSVSESSALEPAAFFLPCCRPIGCSAVGVRVLRSRTWGLRVGVGGSSSSLVRVTSRLGGWTRGWGRAWSSGSSSSWKRDTMGFPRPSPSLPQRNYQFISRRLTNKDLYLYQRCPSVLRYTWGGGYLSLSRVAVWACWGALALEVRLSSRKLRSSLSSGTKSSTFLTLAGHPGSAPSSGEGEHQNRGWGGFSPGVAEGASVGAEEPNQREMKPRFWGGCSWFPARAGEAGVEGLGAAEAGDWASRGCSGDCAARPQGSAEGEAPATSWGWAGAADGGGAGGGWGAEAWVWKGLPVEAPLWGTTGDWEPEEGLWPLAGPGEPKPLLRDSRFSRKLVTAGAAAADEESLGVAAGQWHTQEPP
ncbi:hypothetical protein CRUP_013568 [Coryphaenoides rupestris]|nr:hypothetical protein CRUP_013568 [Coryphaenoides rupestris]